MVMVSAELEPVNASSVLLRASAGVLLVARILLAQLLELCLHRRVPSAPDKIDDFLPTFTSALGEICPCTNAAGGGYDHEKRRTKVAFTPKGSKKDFCDCVSKHGGGCRLIKDLSSPDAPDIGLAFGQEGVRPEASKSRHRDDLWGVWVHPDSSVPGHPDMPYSLILGHELAHVWDYLNPGLPAGKRNPQDETDSGLRWGEVHAVRAENQIAREIGSDHRRTTYPQGPKSHDIPDPDKPHIPDYPREECEKWYDSMK